MQMWLFIESNDSSLCSYSVFLSWKTEELLLVLLLRSREAGTTVPRWCSLSALDSGNKTSRKKTSILRMYSLYKELLLCDRVNKNYTYQSLTPPPPPFWNDDDDNNNNKKKNLQIRIWFCKKQIWQNNTHPLFNDNNTGWLRDAEKIYIEIPAAYDDTAIYTI